MISFISLFEIISLVIPDPQIFFSTAASVADANAVTSIGVRIFLANGVRSFFY